MGDNSDYHRSRQRQTFNMIVKSMRISFDHFIYCIVLYKCKTIFSIVLINGKTAADSKNRYRLIAEINWIHLTCPRQHIDNVVVYIEVSRPCIRVRLLTGMDRNAPERTGMDLHNRNGPQNLP